MTDKTPQFLPGIQLDLQFVHLDPQRRMRARVIGSLDGQGLIITAPVEGREQAIISEGDDLIARYISGRNICAFRATVLKVAALPYRHVHLSFPNRVEETAVRDAERAAVSVPVRVESAAGAQPVAAEICDLSATGAMLRSPVDLGPVDAEIELEFEARFGGQPLNVHAAAIVRNQRIARAADGTEVFLHGIRFKALDPQQELFLRGFVLETIALGRN